MKRVLASLIATLFLLGVTATGSALHEGKKGSDSLAAKAAKIKAIMKKSHQLAVKTSKKPTKAKKVAAKKTDKAGH